MHTLWLAYYIQSVWNFSAEGLGGGILSPHSSSINKNHFALNAYEDSDKAFYWGFMLP